MTPVATALSPSNSGGDAHTGVHREAAAVLVSQHLFGIMRLDQAAPHKGAQNACAGGCLNLVHGSLIEPAGWVEDHAQRCDRGISIDFALLTLFHKTGSRPHFHYAERRVLAEWRSWSKARERYSAVKAPVTLIYGDKDWSRMTERSRTAAALKHPRMFTLATTGHFSAVENPREIARIVLS